MKGPELQEPAYVLHRRPWRETSLMVDLFSLNHGRMTVIARGANSAKSPLKAQLQPFQPLIVDWAGRGDLKTLTQVDVRAGPTITRTVSLYRKERENKERVMKAKKNKGATSKRKNN